MAFGKTAGCLILAGTAMASAAQFPVRQGHDSGVLTVDEQGVSFAGPKARTSTWLYRDIQQLTLSPDEVAVVTYQDKKWVPGSRSFRFSGKVPAAELYELLKDRLDQRFVAALPQEGAMPAWSFPVKYAGRFKGSEGMLVFDSRQVVYSTPAKDGSRTWRYGDIDHISSSGPFELTVTTFEIDKGSDRREFHFLLKERISEATYNAIWMQIQEKNGKLQLTPVEHSADSGSTKLDHRDE